MSPSYTPTIWRRLWLDLLVWQHSSNLSCSCIRGDFAFDFHRAHNPFFFTGGFSMKRAPFLLQRRPQQQRDDRGLSCWSPSTYHTDDIFRLRADYTALRSTILSSAFGSISSPPMRQLQLMDHSAAELPKPHPSDLFALRLASMLHSTSPRPAGTSPNMSRRPALYFSALRGGGVCTTRHGQ